MNQIINEENSDELEELNEIQLLSLLRIATKNNDDLTKDVEQSNKRIEELKESIDYKEMLFLKNRLNNLQKECDKQQEIILKDIDNVLNEKIEKQVSNFKDKYFDGVKSLIENLDGANSIISDMNKLIEEKTVKARGKFVDEFILKKQKELTDKFNELFYDFIDKTKVDGEVKKYVDRIAKSTLRDMRDDNVDKLVRLIYERIVRKFNVVVSKEIVKEMSDMSTIQVQTMKLCFSKINEKQQKYLMETREAIKSLEYMD